MSELDTGVLEATVDPAEVPAAVEEPVITDGTSENDEEKDREDVIAAYQATLLERNSK